MNRGLLRATRLSCGPICVGAVAILCVLLTGCSSRSTRLEELSVSGKEAISESREYAGVSAEKATNAARKVLRLSGYSVFPTSGGLIAALEPYAFAPDLPPPAFWTVRVETRQQGTLVEADLRTHYGGTAYIREAPSYLLFFERLDYLLKVRSKWTTCAEATARWPGKTAETGVRALCFRTKSSGFWGRVLVEPDPDKLLPRTTPTPAEWLTLTTRRYADIIPDQVLDAAKKALTRSQPAFEYRDIPGGFVARVTKYRMYYLVIAAGDSYDTHFWEVRARRVPGGSLVSVYVTTETDSSGAVGAGIGATVGGSSHKMPGLPSRPLGGSGVYGLFWARLENTLGLTSHWPTCEEAREKRWLAMPDPICFEH